MSLTVSCATSATTRSRTNTTSDNKAGVAEIVAAAFIDRLPHDALSPETTEGDDGFVHPYVIQAGVERTSVRLLVRDLTAGLKEKDAMLERRHATAPAARVRRRVMRT